MTRKNYKIWKTKLSKAEQIKKKMKVICAICELLYLSEWYF